MYVKKKEQTLLFFKTNIKRDHIIKTGALMKFVEQPEDYEVIKSTDMQR